jgi:hypothetical protein
LHATDDGDGQVAVHGARQLAVEESHEVPLGHVTVTLVDADIPEAEAENAYEPGALFTRDTEAEHVLPDKEHDTEEPSIVTLVADATPDKEAVNEND